MESPLKRVLDYKLVFDCLCGSNGMVRLETLTARWPASQAADPDSKMPQGCVKHWTKCADKDGYLDWASFSTGLQLALTEDAARLTQVSGTDIPRSKAEQRLASLRLKGATAQNALPPLSKVTAADIESFLSECSKEVLAQTLRRMRKEVYRGQLSMQRMTASADTSLAKKSNDERPSEKRASRPDSGKKTGGIAAKEREELTYGLEMLERTRKWYKERLKLLATEKSKNSKAVKTEELLEVLERGKSTKNEMLQHLKEINGHLETLSSPAPSLTAELQKRLQEQLKKWNKSQPVKQASKSQPVGPPPAHVGEAVVEEPDGQPTFIIEEPTKPTFPVRTSEELSQGKRTHSLSAKRSASTTEVHRVGTRSSQDRAGGYRQDRSYYTQPRYASSHNVSTLNTQSNSSRNQTRPERAQPRRTPVRSISLSSSSTRSTKSDSQSDHTSSVSDYPAHRLQQYPLRGTSSMQELQPGHRTTSSDKHRTMPQGQLSKSSSVRNVSSSRGNYTNGPVVAPDLMHQQVYSSGISHSAQALPTSRSSNRTHSHHHGGQTRSHNLRQTRTEHKGADQYNSLSMTQRVGDSVRSLV